MKFFFDDTRDENGDFALNQQVRELLMSDVANVAVKNGLIAAEDLRNARKVGCENMANKIESIALKMQEYGCIAERKVPCKKFVTQYKYKLKKNWFEIYQKGVAADDAIKAEILALYEQRANSGEYQAEVYGDDYDEYGV